MARRCGAKRVIKSKCTKRTGRGQLLKFRCPKWIAAGTQIAVIQNAENTARSNHSFQFRCPKIAREARAQVKISENRRVRAMF